MEKNAVMDRLHAVQLEIMDEIHRICVKNNIEYFLDSGSALGAVRHRGFIPWDDDIDVGMFRNEYDKFIDCCKYDLSSQFVLQTIETDPAFYKYSAKIRKLNTFFPEEVSGGLKYQGIFIDIFPFDYLSDDKDSAIKEIHRGRFLFKTITNHRGGALSPRWSHRVFHYIQQIIPLLYLERKYHEHCVKHNSKPTHSLTCYSYKMSLTKDLVFDKTMLTPVKLMKFEDREYFVMENYDSYLKTMFGDYMKLPSESDREIHLSGEIKF